MKIAIWIAAACSGVAIAGLLALANELGRFCEEINPYPGMTADEYREFEDRKTERDCNGCMGAAFGDCEECRKQEK